MITTWLGAVYVLAAAGMAVYGLLGLLTLWFYWRHRHDSFPCPEVTGADLPRVTVQLPVFNERYVVGRLIETTAAMDYPMERLQIQVIDDSDDDTTERASALVDYYQRKGVNINLLHRQHRQGYKAGALAAALEQASGDFIAIFDADFQPEPDFLYRTIPHFQTDERLGIIQSRWGHLNTHESSLTAAQAIALDKHFAIEQTVRHRADLFPKFNGTAGVWRRSCLEAAGSWQDDTVCEDLCLSTRAILKGWRMRFLNDVVASAELPTSMPAYKNQQARWAKGSCQCLLKYGLAILGDSQHTFIARLYALLSMSAYGTHLLLLLLLLLQVPLIYLNHQLPSELIFLGIAGLGQPLLFVLGQQVLYSDWRRRLRYLPALLLVAVGTAPSNSRAILQAVFGRRHIFIRTPKGGLAQANSQQPAAKSYRLPFDWIILVELSLACYAGFGLALALLRRNFGPLFLLITCLMGFSYVAYLSLRERF